jgi:hypothetical protein
VRWNREKRCNEIGAQAKFEVDVSFSQDPERARFGLFKTILDWDFGKFTKYERKEGKEGKEKIQGRRGMLRMERKIKGMENVPMRGSARNLDY